MHYKQGVTRAACYLVELIELNTYIHLRALRHVDPRSLNNRDDRRT